MRSRFPKLSFWMRIGALVTAGTLSVFGALAPIAGASAMKKKQLSMPTVTISASTTAGPGQLYVAEAQGFFKAQGVNVNYLASASSATQITTLLAGSAQFELGGVASAIQAASQGAPLRGLEMGERGSAQEIVMTQAAATQFGVPASGNSPAATLKQLRALKGSHLVIAVSTVISNSYVALSALAQSVGLTYGLACATCDLNITTVGSATAETTALIAGKVPAIISTPPSTVIAAPPATVTIQGGLVPPISNFASSYLVTTVSMIQQHSDTVQAVVTGFVQAGTWMKSHAKKAEADVAKYLAINGITSPEEQEYLYNGSANHFYYPFPSRAAYDLAVKVNNAGSAVPINIPYSTLVVSKFATNAGKALHVKLN